MNKEKDALHPDIIYVNSEKDGVQVEAALQWCSDAYSDSILGFANNIRTVDGGTHIEGLKTVLTRTLNAFAKKLGKRKESDSNLAGENIREGLTAVLSVKVPEPEFEGQTKTKLGNTEAGHRRQPCGRSPQPVPRVQSLRDRPDPGEGDPGVQCR